MPTFGDKQPEIAVYDRRRFWCLTGHRLKSAPRKCERRQTNLEALLTKLFPSPPSVDGTANRSGKPQGSWLDRLIADCRTARKGKRSERDFALCSEAVRRGCSADEIWAQVADIGKFAESGRNYFDTTWNSAQTVVSNAQLQPHGNGNPNILAEADSLDLRLPSARSDTANARRFVACHKDNVRWCQKWEKWLVWDGQRWAVDQERRVEFLAKNVVDNLWSDVGKLLPTINHQTATALDSFARTTANVRGISSMLQLARSEPGIPMQPVELDAHPWLFNCSNGTVDLKTGELKRQDRNDYLTKLCPNEYLPAANGGCPQWKSVLKKIFGDNRRLIRFVRRMLGSAMVGEVAEQMLPIFWGTGANGKSLLVETILKAMGPDYADKGASRSTFGLAWQSPSDRKG